jgi:hypothetical protein
MVNRPELEMTGRSRQVPKETDTAGRSVQILLSPSDFGFLRIHVLHTHSSTLLFEIWTRNALSAFWHLETPKFVAGGMSSHIWHWRLRLFS